MDVLLETMTSISTSPSLLHVPKASSIDISSDYSDLFSDMKEYEGFVFFSLGLDI